MESFGSDSTPEYRTSVRAVEDTVSRGKIENLKIGKAVDAEVEICPHASLKTGGSPRRASRDASAWRNSCAADENPDISLPFNKADREYPGISEHLGYWGIFVRKGS